MLFLSFDGRDDVEQRDALDAQLVVLIDAQRLSGDTGLLQVRELLSIEHLRRHRARKPDAEHPAARGHFVFVLHPFFLLGFLKQTF